MLPVLKSILVTDVMDSVIAPGSCVSASCVMVTWKSMAPNGVDGPVICTAMTKLKRIAKMPGISST